MRLDSWIRTTLRRAARRPARKSAPTVRNLLRLEDRVVPIGQTISQATILFPYAHPDGHNIASSFERRLDVDFFAADLNRGDFLTVDIDARRTDQDLTFPYTQLSEFDSYLRIFHRYPSGVLHEVVNNDNAPWEHPPHDTIQDSRVQDLRIDDPGRWYFGVSTSNNRFYNPEVAGPRGDPFDPARLVRTQVRVVRNPSPQAFGGVFGVLEDHDLPGFLSSSDPHNDPRTYSIVRGPAHGGFSAFNLGNGFFTYRPNAHFFGTDSFDFVAVDAYGAVSNAATVTIHVIPVNDPPSYTPGGNVTVLEDTGPHSFVNWATNISIGPPNEAGQGWSFEVSNNNPGLFRAQGQPAISPSGSLTFHPAADAFGAADVTVRLRDTGGTANGGLDVTGTYTFRITVDPVNDRPSFTGGGDRTVREDAGPHAFPGWATGVSIGPPNEAGQDWSFEVIGNTNPGLFQTAPAVSRSGTLTFHPAANAFGSSDIKVRLRDTGGTANGGVDVSGEYTFRITVDPVNDAPSFVGGGTGLSGRTADMRSWTGRRT
jgi:hypothetical protein